MMNDWRCETCHVHMREKGEPDCSECRRRKWYGAIIGAFDYQNFYWTVDGEPCPTPAILDALDAIANLMTERRRTERRWQREIGDEQRRAQRDARNAHDEGFDEGQRSQREY